MVYEKWEIQYSPRFKPWAIFFSSRRIEATPKIAGPKDSFREQVLGFIQLLIALMIYLLISKTFTPVFCGSTINFAPCLPNPL
jgi:hypothetical protein